MIYKVTCVHCNQEYELEFDEKCFKEWKEGAYVQHAFPDLTAGERELLISGTCDSCWKRFYP